MIADFREYYGLRLTDVARFDGSLPVWEAAILTRQLPQTSRTFAAQQGGVEYLGWDMDRYFLAAIVDLLNANLTAFVQSHSKKKVKVPPPVPRPGDAERKKQQMLNNPFAVQVNSAMNELKEKEA